MIKRNHYTSVQRMAHVISWKRSGKTIAEYSKQHGINPLTFTKWGYRNRDTNSGKKLQLKQRKRKFIPIQVLESPNVLRHHAMKVEIEFPNGTRVHIN